MHVKKNMFDNIFNTVVDNMNVRMDLALYYDYWNLELLNNELRVIKLKVTFVLDKDAHFLVYKRLKNLRFPDGYALNIAKLVNLEGCRLYEMKIHNFHVFIQTLISITYRNFLSKEIWNDSWGLVIILEIFVRTSCISSRWSYLKWTSLRKFVNLR